MQGIRTRVGEAAAALRGVFANPGLRRIELAFAGSAIGDYAFFLTLGVFAYRQGGATAVGVVTAVRLAVAATVSPFTASLADRFPRRRVMLAADLGRCAAVAVAGTLAAAGTTPTAVYALAILTSVFATAFRPAEASLLPELAATPEELVAANVTSSTFESVGIFAGPALAAPIYAVGGAGWAFAFVAATYAWSSLNVARIPAAGERTAGSDEAEEEGGASLTAGFRAVGAEPRLRLLIGLYGAQAFGAGALSVLIVATALDLLGIGTSGVGLLEAACGVGAVVGAGVSLAHVAGGRLARELAIGLAVWGLPLLLVAAAPHAVVATVALGLLGIGNTMVDINAMTLIQREARKEVAGRVFGVLEAVLIAAIALGAVAAPALIGIVGVRGALLAVGALVPVLALLATRSLAAIDADERLPEAELAALRTVPFLALLPQQSLEFLAGRAVRLEVPAGAYLFREGDEGDRFYILEHGAIAVELEGGDKVERAPAFAGEVALLRDVPRTASVRVAEDAVLLALERRDFLEAVQGHASARRGADEIAGGRLRAATSA